MGMSIWENNGNGNKCLAGMGMGMEKGLKRMGRNGKAESHSHTALLVTLLYVSRCVVCEAWTSQANTNFSNGLRHDASKLELCQRACFSNSECDGLDWVHNAADGQRCWLSGPWSGTRNIGTASGAVTHYDFNRNCHTQGNH